MTKHIKNNPMDTSSRQQADPRHFVRSLENVLTVEVVADGDNVPVVIHNVGGRRFLVVSEVFEVTNEPFFDKRGLFENLKALRKAENE
jgi:hypothetical protein